MQKAYQDEEPFYKPKDLSYLEDWVFHFNSFRNEWNAIPRETYNEYWSKFDHPSVLRSVNLNTLLDLLHKTKGSKELIENLTNGQIK